MAGLEEKNPWVNVQEKAESEQQLDKKPKKKPRQKKYYFRRFVKEIKRVKWPSQRQNWISFFQIVIFTIVFTACVVFFATLIGWIFAKSKVN